MSDESYSEFRDPHAATLDLGLPPPTARPQLSWPEPGTTLAADLPRGRLPGLSTSLFVQAYVKEVRDLERLVRYTGVGAVLTVDRREKKVKPLHQAIRSVAHIRQRCLTENILVDHNAYSGKNRKLAGDGLSQQWIQDQHTIMRLNWAMTDSGFSRNLTDLRMILTGAAAFVGNIIVALPMTHELLRDEASSIADLINAQPHPVALMLEHASDPFDEPGVVPGLIEILTRCTSGVLLLRSDTSALGAISHGAHLGAVGTRGGLRHIYPVSDGGGKENLAFLIPALLGYFQQQRFERAYLKDPRQAAWYCGCFFCSEQALTWIGNHPEDLAFRAGFQHSVAALATIGAQLEGFDTRDAAAAWAILCDRAAEEHDRLANPSGSPWTPKPALAAWRHTTPRPTA